MEMSRDSIPIEIQHYEKKIYDQRQLIELSKALNSQLELNDLIDSILNSCLAQVQTFNAGVLLKEDVDSEVLTLHYDYKGFEITNHKQFSLDIYSPLIEFFQKHPEALTWEKISNNSDFEEEIKILTELELKLVVPLRAKGEVHGLVLLGSKAIGDDYPESEIIFLEQLASIAGVAVLNARLYELATTDMMTKLKIHHFFQTQLRVERKKSIKRNTPLSFLITDIDHFKKFNDSYGHQAGDAVLKEVARVLIKCARKIDTASRYGGEEFCLILPKTDTEEAIEIAEKVRREIENLVVLYQGLELRVTVSVGVSKFDKEEDSENKNLIEKADKALYKAKDSGRNKVISYTKDLVEKEKE